MANNPLIQLDAYPFRPMHVAPSASDAAANASPTLLSQWRDASRAAADAERVLFETSMFHLWGEGAEASAEQRSNAARQRQAERDLFNAAMLIYSGS